MHENIVALFPSHFHAPQNLESLGHVDAFNDPLIDNRDFKKNATAPMCLFEDFLNKLDDKIEKEVEKAAKRFGEKFDADLYRQTNPRVMEYAEKRRQYAERYAASHDQQRLVRFSPTHH